MTNDDRLNKLQDFYTGFVCGVKPNWDTCHECEHFTVRSGWGEYCKASEDFAQLIIPVVGSLGYLPVEPVEIEGLTEDSIDNLRMQTMSDMGKIADKTWWDICAAYEKMYGEDAALTAEQLLIDLTNNTGLKVSQATIDKIKQQGALYRRVNRDDR